MNPISSIYRAVRRFLIARAIRKCLVDAASTASERRMGREVAKLASAIGARHPDQIQSVGGGEGYFWTTSTSSFVVTDRAPSPEAPKLDPGRQIIPMPSHVSGSGLFGMFERPWSRPFPANAQGAPWEDLHRFAPGVQPTRDPYLRATSGCEPPTHLECPACELEQTPLTSGERNCPYCGLKMRLWGSRIFWWRDHLDVPAWEPKG